MLLSLPMLALDLGPPRPQTGPESPFPGKRVLGSKNPHFPSSWKREFSVQKKEGCFLTENSLSGLCESEGKWGVLGPETLFSRNGDSDPGVGGIPSLDNLLYHCFAGESQTHWSANDIDDSMVKFLVVLDCFQQK